MLKPINSTYSFKADTMSVNSVTGEYEDPLMKWPLRGAAFTNEVGEALRPLIGDLATVSWVPALLYIGADVYDKYKNNQTEYSPNSERCLKQAVFQGMASIALPLVAVKFGQNLFSLFGGMEEDKLTYNYKEHVTKTAQQFVANGKMRAYRNNDDECRNAFLDSVNNSLDYRKEKNTEKNPLKKIYRTFEKKTTSALKINSKENIDNFATETIDELILIRKRLLSPTDEFLKTDLYESYKIATDNGQTNNVAVKSVLNSRLHKKMLKGKTVKTIGGFIALALAIKPIDNFVEHVLIGKVINNTIENIDKIKVNKANKSINTQA
ncbi:MAG: hypothetical protein E7Z89_05985 [Cyanobacteria bacterium SIG28]|nr:hypothetical protein [Cyanobacteria bacterium SIG28]